MRAAARPLTLALIPTSVTGGGVSTGTVTLGSAAPSGGAVVTLSSSNTSVATVPPTVAVAEGSTTATFTVNTSAVTSSTSVTISATYGTTQTATLTVTSGGGGSGNGQFVQWASCDSGAVGSSNCYQDRSATSGNMILVFSHWDNQSLTAAAYDNLGNTYTPIGGPVSVGTSARFQAWYAKNVSGGVPLAVTVRYSGVTTSFSLVDIIEYSGLDKTAPLDVYAFATGTGTVQDSGPSPMTTESNETIVGLFGYAGYATPYTAGTGFTLRNYDASSMLEDKAVTTTGIYNAIASSAVSTDWVAYVLAFK